MGFGASVRHGMIEPRRRLHASAPLCGAAKLYPPNPFPALLLRGQCAKVAPTRMLANGGFLRFTARSLITCNGSNGEGFRTPALCGTVVRRRGRRSKASQGGNRGEEGGCLVGRDLWGFEDRGRLASGASAAGGARSCRRKRRWRAGSVARMRGAGVGAAVGGGLATSRGHRAPAPARGWRRRRSALRGGMRGDGHEVSILIRLGDGERAGRGAFERLDDDHPAAAARAAARRRRCFGLAVGLGAARSGARSRPRRAIGGRARCCPARTAPANRP